MSRAQQLSLQLSLAASTEVTEQCARLQGYIEELEAKLDADAQAKATLEGKLERLKKDNKSWERSYKRLKAERDQIYQARLSDADHPLHQECQRLQEQTDGLRNTLRQWVERSLETSPGRLGTGPSKADLTRLLTLAHPDKWSQGQPATALAHEVTVLVNKLREGVQA